MNHNACNVVYTYNACSLWRTLENKLLAVQRPETPQGSKARTATGRTGRMDEMCWNNHNLDPCEWQCHAIPTIDNRSFELAGIYAAKRGSWLDARALVRPGKLRSIDVFDQRVAIGLAMCKERDSKFISKDFQREKPLSGNKDLPSCANEAQDIDTAAHMVHILTENLILVSRFRIVEDLRLWLTCRKEIEN